ncbi:hypothetical protein Y032_0050g2062 [Ancylostoma ceylanicum]|uniref:Zinc metalloproteinase n=1 Tax=Ancylostoma ceylanicum TaxID=53326 RepID=A0A016U8S8_9BILA|nr:hypothetical protein Y032_0050g2062 [Ancylostoma ceylanicum]
MTGALGIAALFIASAIGVVIGSDPDELTGRSYRYRRQAQIRGDKVPPQVMYYYYQKGLSIPAKELFSKATKAWEKDTCVKFKYNATAKYAIVVSDNTSICLFTRDQDGDGQVLDANCRDIGDAMHEVGHALWLDHTHNRYDRDDYVNVSWENIELYKKQYEKVTKDQSKNYDVPYDYGSIMHYAFTDEYPPLILKDEKYRNSNTAGSHLISFTDLCLVNKHFRCDEKCPPEKSANCTNHGFPNPNNCSTCVCPGGYGGRLCDERPKGCGSIYNATKDWKKISRVIKAPYDKKKKFIIIREYSICTNWIKSPNGTKIEVEIEKIAGLKSWRNIGCVDAAIEIKTNKDQRLTGYRYCTENHAGVTLKSDSNLVPIITYTLDRWNALNVTLRYRYVE